MSSINANRKSGKVFRFEIVPVKTYRPNIPVHKERSVLLQTFTPHRCN